jgi:hypothetical protein
LVIQGWRLVAIGSGAREGAMHIELDESERALLLDLLEELLGELRDEIYRAESHDFKEQLKVRKALVLKVMGRLRAETPVAAG